ncbi:MAG: YceI family protein [Planctomycetota bacterium]
MKCWNLLSKAACGVLLTVAIIPSFGCNNAEVKEVPTAAAKPAGSVAGTEKPVAEKPAVTAAATAPAASSAPPVAAASEGSDKGTPVAIEGGKAKLTPANSKVMFVGIHTGDKPDPRTCGFAEFSGEASFGQDGKTLSAVTIEMQVDSIYTFNGSLTEHLKSGDFFDAREYPTAKFESTKVEIGPDGKGTLTGKLSLMKGSEEVAIPVTMTQSDSGFTLKGEISIDRTKFGMDKMTEKIGKEVAVSFVIGETTDPSSVLPK